MLNNVGYDAFQVSPDLLGGNADRLYPTYAAPLVAASIVRRGGIVRQAIHLDGEAGGFAEEVQDERAERMLPAKLQAARALPQDTPQSDLRRAHAFAKVARLMD